MWNTCTESMCHPLFRKELAMRPIVITDEQQLWASQRACVVPLSMPRHAQDTVMQFLLSLPGVVYGGDKAFSWAVMDLKEHLMFWGIELIEQDSQSIFLDSPSIAHYSQKWRTENTFSGSATLLKGTSLFHFGPKVKLINAIRGPSLCEIDRNGQWNRQCR